MTDEQRLGVRARLIGAWSPGAEFHHGSCAGADVEAAALAREIGHRTIAHPGPDGRWRAAFADDEVRPAKAHLVRNADIVDEVDLMIAAPRATEVARSGTARDQARRAPRQANLRDRIARGATAVKMSAFQTLKKIMERTFSTSDAESLASIRAANRLLAAEGITWERVLSRTINVVAEVEEDPERRREAPEIESLLAEAERARPQSAFVQSLREQFEEKGRLSEKQIAALRDVRR